MSVIFLKAMPKVLVVGDFYINLIEMFCHFIENCCFPHKSLLKILKIRIYLLSLSSWVVELDQSFRQLIREVSMPPPSLTSGAIPIEVLFSEPFLLVTLKQTAFWVRHTSPRYLLSPLRKLEFHRRFKIILKVSNG